MKIDGKNSSGTYYPSAKPDRYKLLDVQIIGFKESKDVHNKANMTIILRNGQKLVIFYFFLT